MRGTLGQGAEAVRRALEHAEGREARGQGEEVELGAGLWSVVGAPGLAGEAFHPTPPDTPADECPGERGGPVRTGGPRVQWGAMRSVGCRRDRWGFVARGLGSVAWP